MSDLALIRLPDKRWWVRFWARLRRKPVPTISHLYVNTATGSTGGKMVYTIRCDNCGKDLTSTTNSVDYRLELRPIEISAWEGAVSDAMVYPPIEEQADFCGIDCLREWVLSPKAPAGFRRPK